MRFFPRFPVFVDATLKISPTEYPVPPIETVAAIATPLFTVKFTLAPLPKPLILIKSTFENTVVVYPVPGFVITNVPVVPVLIPPRTFTNFEEKLELFFCVILTPEERFC